ncbi:ATP-binding cassette sub-family C member 4-like [Zophobas morio]|uniref:ATP-binding cassette sub-family C member 4-like n=1 Tax=Zophobas morio TaxID=2755281 RepID=UPI003083DD36
MTLIREGYNSRKPRTLSSEQIHSFIMQTPDEHSLATKEYHREFPVLLFFLKLLMYGYAFQIFISSLLFESSRKKKKGCLNLSTDMFGFGGVEAACLAISVNKLKLKSLTKTDERYQLIKEALGAIKVIKMNLWEESYEKKIAKIRKEEVHLIRNINILLFLKLVLSESIHNASWYILVTVSIWFKIQSNAGTLFLIMNSLNAISGALKRNFPAALHEVATLIAVFKRIRQTLQIKSEKSLNLEDNNVTRKIKLNLKIYTTNNDTLLTLRNCNIGSGITIITGPVASGKSLLLKVITKEYRNIEGDLEVVGSISYASQEPWLFPSTIKQNILFGSSYNENRYLEVLRVCALLEELRFLSDGDSAFVTDGGANLSKGQQARINLARAVYKERDIYLLDDCLSSLDAIVADFVFEQCIKTFLKDKIVILVTPSIKYVM